MAGQSSASITSLNGQYDKSNLSRRSVDWRDSGIVIDEDQQPFNSFDQFCESSSAAASVCPSTYSQQSLAQTPSAFCCPLQQIAYDQDEDGDTILHLAVVGFTLSKVRDLIKICDLNAINNMMQTPLHVAVLANRPEMVELLIEAGARLNVHDRRGNTPVHLACQKGHKETLMVIFEAIEKAPKTIHNLKPEQYIEMTNFDGQTCIHLAASNDHRQILELLINKYKANINCRDSKSGETIIHRAITKYNVDLVAFLFGISKNCVVPDYSGREPLDTIKILRESRLAQQQLDKLAIIERLIIAKINSCRNSNCCCTNRQNTPLVESDDEILDSETSSNYTSDSDSDMN